MTCPQSHFQGCHIDPTAPNGSPNGLRVCRCLDAPPVKDFFDPGEGSPGIPVVAVPADPSDIEDGGGLSGDGSLESVPLVAGDGDVIPSGRQDNPVPSHGGNLPSSTFAFPHTTIALTHSLLDIPARVARSFTHVASSSLIHTSTRIWPVRTVMYGQ